MTLFQKSFFQKPVSLVLIISLASLSLGPILLLPRKAQAQCPVTVVADAPQSQQTGLQTVWEGLQDAFRKGSITELITQTGELIWQNAHALLTWAAGVLLNLLLHQILAMLTNDIVNWIQNGEEPRFLSMNLKDWLWQATDNALGAFIDQYLGAGWLCEPFDLEIKFALLEVPTFEEEVRCSLSDIVDNVQDFYNNFASGGWKGWIELTKPQNTLYGAYIMAMAEKMSVEETAQAEREKELEMGEGYLSPKDCTWYDASGAVVETQEDVWGTPPLPAACQPDPANPGQTVGGFAAPCDHRCEILTPASTVKRTTDDAVTNFYEQLNAQIAGATAKSGPFQVYVTAIVSALISRIITEGVGLLRTDSSDSSLQPPGQGDIGASVDIPETISPEFVRQEITRAEALLTQLQLLRGNLENRLLAEQQNNLAVLKLVRDTYLEIIPLLENVIEACEDTPYSSYVSWAENQINNINNNIVPSLNQRISRMEADISYTLETINLTNQAIVAVQNYINAANNWLAVHESVGGDPDSPELAAAETAMTQARTEAVSATQTVIRRINGVALSSSFEGLTQEVQQAIANVLNQAAQLELDRGLAEWPESGTLYGELQAAYDLREEANQYLLVCLGWEEEEGGGGGGEEGGRR